MPQNNCIEVLSIRWCLQEDRLRGRGTETEESLSKRLAVAKAELEYGMFVFDSDLTYFLL